MATNNHRRPWTRGEKAILIGMLAAIVVTLSIAGLANYDDENPVVHVPTRTLPSPNGFDYFDAASRNVVVGWPMPGTSHLCKQRITSPLPPPGFSGPGGPPPGFLGPGVSMPVPQSTIGYVYVTADDHPDLHDPNVRAAADSVLARNKAAIATFRMGFKYPCADPPLRSFFSLAPVRFRRLADVLALQGQVAAYRHDLDGSVRSALDIMTFGARIQNRAEGIYYSAGDRFEKLGRALLWPQINRLNAAQCQSIASTLDALDASRVPLVAELLEDKWSVEAGLSKYFRLPNWKSQLMNDLGIKEIDPSLRSQIEYRLVTKRQVMIHYIASVDACIVAANGPYGTEPAPTSSDPISDMFTRGYDEARFDEAWTLAQNRLLATTCALRAYKLDHGAYPTTLRQLVPSYLHAVPLDPFTSTSTLSYRLSGGKYVLYSVGPDMRDNGGAAVTMQSVANEYSHRVYLDSHGDIVAGVNLQN